MTNEIEKQLFPNIEKNLQELKENLSSKVIPQLKYTSDNDDSGQRAIADDLEIECKNKIVKHINNSTASMKVKSTEDVKIETNFGKIFIDIKTSDIDREFKMPNLISIDKLKEEWNDYYFLLFNVFYSSKTKKILNVKSFYIWEIPWSYLAIQNLGKGQLQVKSMKNFYDNMNNENFKTHSKDDWYNDLLLNGEEFYNNLLIKTHKRLRLWKM
jgi:hypothetical protein